MGAYYSTVLRRSFVWIQVCPQIIQKQSIIPLRLAVKSLPADVSEHSIHVKADLNLLCVVWLNDLVTKCISSPSRVTLDMRGPALLFAVCLDEPEMSLWVYPWRERPAADRLWHSERSETGLKIFRLGFLIHKPQLCCSTYSSAEQDWSDLDVYGHFSNLFIVIIYLDQYVKAFLNYLFSQTKPLFSLVPHLRISSLFHSYISHSRWLPCQVQTAVCLCLHGLHWTHTEQRKSS